MLKLFLASVFPEALYARIGHGKQFDAFYRDYREAYRTVVWYLACYSVNVHSDVHLSQQVYGHEGAVKWGRAELFPDLKTKMSTN